MLALLTKPKPRDLRVEAGADSVKIAHPFKLGAVLLMGSALALFLWLHALSSVLTTSSSSDAVKVYPWNGGALSNLAFENFYQAAGEGLGSQSLGSSRTGPSTFNADAAVVTVIEGAALQSADAALRAIRWEPLSPKAYAILALAQTDPLKKDQIIKSAARLSKRELALQDLVLAKNISEGNYAGTIETIDQVLRAHPARGEQFFPLLTAALSIDDTLPQFTDLLSKPFPWRDGFLNFALRNDDALDNLAEIRARVVFDNDGFDQRLIGRLAGQGKLTAARQLYQILAPNPSPIDGTGVLEWHDTYPPLDWALASQRGLRADVVKGGKALSVAVSSGRGGVIASRFLDIPDRQFQLRLTHDLNLSDKMDNLKVQVACAGEKSAFFDEAVRDAIQEFRIDARNQNCSMYNLMISARAWTGSNDLNGTISPLTVTKFSGS